MTRPTVHIRPTTQPPLPRSRPLTQFLTRQQIIALAAVLLVNWLLFPGFFTVTRQDGRFFGNLIDVLSRGAPVAILAIGMTMVIATKGVDLSVGAVMAICGATAAVMVTSGYPPPGWPCWPRSVPGSSAGCGTGSSSPCRRSSRSSPPSS